MSVDMGALRLYYGVVVVFSVLAVWYVKLTSGALVPKELVSELTRSPQGS